MLAGPARDRSLPVSYLAPNGHYSETAGGFPSAASNATNYFVDVVFRY
jgi:hypothetical protein